MNNRRELKEMSTEEKFALLTPGGKAIVIQEIERLLIEQNKEQEPGR